jgi:hypothetical protein
MPTPQVPANDPDRPNWQPMRARKQSNALLTLADEKLEPAAAPNRPAAKSLLMMAETMRDAPGAAADNLPGKGLRAGRSRW